MNLVTESKLLLLCHFCTPLLCSCLDHYPIISGILKAVHFAYNTPGSPDTDAWYTCSESQRFSQLLLGSFASSHLVKYEACKSQQFKRVHNFIFLCQQCVRSIAWGTVIVPSSVVLQLSKCPGNLAPNKRTVIIAWNSSYVLLPAVFSYI